jgi:hypothetical protein
MKPPINRSARARRELLQPRAQSPADRAAIGSAVIEFQPIYVLCILNTYSYL